MKHILIYLFSLFILIGSLNAQIDSANVSKKKVLDHSVYTSWKKLDNPKISNNGNFISFEINPQKGDGILHIKDFNDKNVLQISRGYENTFSPNSDFAAFKIKTPEDSLRKLKLAKKKKENFPKDTLGIVLLNNEFKSNSKVLKIPNINSFKVTTEGLSRVAYLTENFTNKKDTSSKSDISIYDLSVYNPLNDNKVIFENVYEYNFSKNGKALGFLTLKKGKVDTVKAYSLNLENDNFNILFSKPGYGKNIAIDNDGKQIAFIYTDDTAKVKRYDLYLNSNKIADTLSEFLPYNCEISAFGDLNFSRDGKKLYFNTASKIQPEPKDTLLEDEKYKVDVWNYQDPYLQTQQLHDLDKDKKKSFMAVYDIGLKSLYQIENEKFEEVKTANYGNSDFYLGIDKNPYKISSSWIQPDQVDIYSINYKTGLNQLIAEGVQQGYSISPMGKYITWFESSDTSWYAYSNETGQKYPLTKELPVKFGNELNDIPNIPDAYGVAGWITNDESILIYDRFDIWKINPINFISASKLTNGREQNIVFRFQDLNKDSLNINPDEKILLGTLNETNWQEGFCETVINQPEIKNLITVDNKFISIYKSKNADKIIFQKMSYNEFPDLWSSDLSFQNYKKISDANPQQKDYLWGTVEIINWKGFNGEDLKGLLYKPENFDESKKYPMISYFYEKYTDRFHQYYSPTPSRSVINFPLYNSNGYLIFIPDISYEIGYPGRSAYNVILSGSKYLADSFAYVDKENIGIQGQSWGGYQVAYLVTRTDFFKAAMSGAPVSNMTSAYGGIRWESGVNRIFQYEKEQSRIGGTLWEKFDLFIENSPLFKAVKVTTPLLIMANDGDGAVPWQQGIEFFVSLRRLDKKVWLLNYNGDEHNLMKWPNRVDLSIRMKQFFDYYLKGEPIPEWMKSGIPALEKGLKSGY